MTTILLLLSWGQPLCYSPSMNFNWPQSTQLRHILAVYIIWFTVVSQIVTFPDGQFPKKDISQKDDSRIVTFPENYSRMVKFDDC